MLIWGLVAMKFSTTPMTPWSSARVVQVMVFWWPLARQLSMGRFGENQNVQQWMVIEIDFTRFYWEILLDFTGLHWIFTGNFTGFYWITLEILLDFYWIFTGYGAFVLVKSSTDMGWSQRDCHLFHWTPTFEKHPMFSGQKNTIISAISVPQKSQPGPKIGDVQGLLPS